jgi:hypothetical protein
MKKIIITSLIILSSLISCSPEDSSGTFPNALTPTETTNPPTETTNPPTGGRVVNITLSSRYNGKLSDLSKLIFVNGEAVQITKQNIINIPCNVGDTVGLLCNFLVPSQFNYSTEILVKINGNNYYNYLTTPSGSNLNTIEVSYIVQ